MACGGDVRTSAGGVVVGSRDDGVGCLVRSRMLWSQEAPLTAHVEHV